MIKIIDNALSDRAYNDLIAQIACGPFKDEVNESDGVTYPLICRSIPSKVTGEISQFIDGEFLEFMRASPEGVACPHPVHHDSVMGRVSMMLYTSYIGGTGIVSHKGTGVMMAPNDPEVVSRVVADCDNVDAWEVVEIAEAKPNRLAIFDARLMHAALPFGGSGSGVKRRTVYTRFVL